MRNDNVGDQFAVLEFVFDVRRVARRVVKIAKRNRPRSSIGSNRMNLRIEDHHRDAHIRWMRGDAVLTHTKHRMAAIEALERIAAGTWLPPVACRVNIPEIRAASPLQDVSGNGRHVANLCRCAREDRFREHGIAIALLVTVAPMAIASSLMSMLDIPTWRTPTTVAGVSTSILIRSISVVPPARNIASGCAATAVTASDA